MAVKHICPCNVHSARPPIIRRCLLCAACGRIDGAQYALTSNLRGRVEYRYAELGTDIHPGDISSFVTHAPLTQHTVRVGVSCAFGAPAPVVAKC